MGKISFTGSTLHLLRQLAGWWWKSIEPTVDINDSDQWHEARLIAGLCLTVLIVAIIGISVTFPGYDEMQRIRLLPTCCGIVLFFLPYRQSRRGLVTAAINSMACIAALLITTACFGAGGAVGREITYYYILVSIFVLVFLGRERTVPYVVAIGGLILVFQVVNPQLSLEDTIRGPFAFNIFGASFVAVFTSFWRTREQEKRRQLEISERKRAELLVKEERQVVLGDFAAAVSHDFRTRLSSVEVNQYLLRRKLERGDSIASVSAHFEATRTTIEQMTYQLENMTLVMGLGHTAQAAVDLRTVVQLALPKLLPLADKQQIDLKVMEADTPVIAYCNQGHIEVAVEHLVQNALAYTPPGGKVTIGISSAEHRSTITVTDTGVGIAAEHITRIFDAFYKVDAARTTTKAGLGLGLTIVNMIAETYSGSLEVESTPGNGSTFRLSLPREAPDS